MEASNAKALREALEAINCINTGGLKRLLVELVESDILDGGLINKTISAVEKARRALSAPLRQCDVGTAEEQAERFGKLCGKYYNEEYPCDKECPLASLPMIHGFPRCQAYWSQTPYGAEEGAEHGKA